MKKPVVIIGMGEMAGVFARGFLRSAYPVFPVTRDMDIQQAAEEIADPELVLVAVAENDLHPVLETMPQNWRDRLVLLQNELLPADWQQHQLQAPTVISVWFEKKKGQDYKVIIPSPVYGPNSQLVSNALDAIGISTRVLASADELLFELVVKNVYILTTNISGLKTGGNVGELWNRHRDTATAVANDVISLQEQLTGKNFDQNALINAMVHAFEGDLDHGCMGRSAPARLARALELAKQYAIQLPAIEAIA
ncbi:MAG: hypothetical protein OQL06_07570 [Gammaproteobacteria bacterium]|nr:hypothetical protein [Gammaproteobacteria bacterium]